MTIEIHAIIEIAASLEPTGGLAILALSFAVRLLAPCALARLRRPNKRRAKLRRRAVVRLPVNGVAPGLRLELGLLKGRRRLR